MQKSRLHENTTLPTILLGRVESQTPRTLRLFRLVDADSSVIGAFEGLDRGFLTFGFLEGVDRAVASEKVVDVGAENLTGGVVVKDYVYLGFVHFLNLST